MENKFYGLVTLNEAADLIGVTSSYLRAEIKRGKLEIGIDCEKFGKQWVVDKERFIDKYKRDNK